MPKNPISVQEILSQNLQVLLDSRASVAPTQMALAGKSGVAQSTIGRILRQETAAGIDSVEAIAKVYGVFVWQMLVPNLNPEKLPSLLPITHEEIEIYERLHKAAQDLVQYKTR